LFWRLLCINNGSYLLGTAVSPQECYAATRHPVDAVPFGVS